MPPGTLATHGNILGCLSLGVLLASRLGEARDAAKDPSGHRTTPWLRVVRPRVSAGRELGPFGWGLGGPAVPGLVGVWEVLQCQACTWLHSPSVSQRPARGPRHGESVTVERMKRWPSRGQRALRGLQAAGELVSRLPDTSRRGPEVSLELTPPPCSQATRCVGCWAPWQSGLCLAWGV